MKHYGFIAPKIITDGEKPHYVLGALPKEALVLDRKWKPYLPDFELQNRFSLETYNCTSFGTIRAILTLIARKYGVFLNFSDRDLGIKAGTKPPGNDPHIVAEAARKQGLIKEATLPWTPDIDTIEEYYSYGTPEKAKECEAESKLFEYDIRHEWLWSDHTLPVEEKRERILESLTYSPVCVSVYAWRKRKGIYFKAEGDIDNHWVTIVGVNKDGTYIIADQYEPFLKNAAQDYDFAFAKRFSVEKREVADARIPLIQYALSLAYKILAIFKPRLGGALPFNLFPLQAALESLRKSLISLKKKLMEPSNAEKIYQAAKDALGTEASPRDIAPDELGCAETADEIVKRATGKYVNGTTKTVTISTAEMYKILSRNPEWEEIYLPEKGALIISPTVGKNVGHVGICGIYGIMSNNSPTGTFEQNFTYDGWDRYYRVRKKLEIHYFRRK